MAVGIQIQWLVRTTACVCIDVDGLDNEPKTFYCNIVGRVGPLPPPHAHWLVENCFPEENDCGFADDE